jgi:NADH-quinone oxidoreductase subunit F
MKKITARLVAGEASPDDLDTLESVAYQIDGRTICAFGEACAWPVESMIDKFRDELLAETVEGNAQSPRNAEQEAQRRYLKDAVAYADKP